MQKKRGMLTGSKGGSRAAQPSGAPHILGPIMRLRRGRSCPQEVQLTLSPFAPETPPVLVPVWRPARRTSLPSPEVREASLPSLPMVQGLQAWLPFPSSGRIPGLGPASSLPACWDSQASGPVSRVPRPGWIWACRGPYSTCSPSTVRIPWWVRGSRRNARAVA